MDKLVLLKGTHCHYLCVFILRMFDTERYERIQVTKELIARRSNLTSGAAGPGL